MGNGIFGLITDSLKSEKEEFVNYTIHDGLPDNSVWGILEDESGYLWLSTENGLSRFDPITGRCNNYNEDDGLPFKRFHYLASHKSGTGQIFFGGDNG